MIIPVVGKDAGKWAFTKAFGGITNWYRFLEDDLSVSFKTKCLHALLHHFSFYFFFHFFISPFKSPKLQVCVYNNIYVHCSL